MAESESKHIKLHIPGESFWAEQLTEDTACVDNILLNSEIGYKDIVKFNPENHEVISVLVKKSNTFAIKYSTANNIQETYKKIVEYFEEKSVGIEGIFAGMALLSVPVGIPETALHKIVSDCPITIELIENENEEDED